MRTTSNIDDQLLAEAQRICGITEKAALVREGLRALIEHDSARRLAQLSGSEPQVRMTRRCTKHPGVRLHAEPAHGSEDDCHSQA